MKLEVRDRSNPLNYCVATVIETHGQRLRLRYDGFGEIPDYDVWFHFKARELFPIGWCANQGIPLQPPTGGHFMYIYIRDY